MDKFIYLQYPDKIVKFNLWKNYGIDKNLMLGDKPVPRKVTADDIVLDYTFLLELLPLEIWIKIFDILYLQALVKYRHLVSCELEYNMHRLFKTKRHREDYRGFSIKISASPGLYQFYSTVYNEKEIREFYGYSCSIYHSSLNEIEKLSDYVPRYNKFRCLSRRSPDEDLWGLNLTTDHDNDFVFTHGFNPENIMKRIELHEENGKIKTFKTLEYNSYYAKKLIDNFYDKNDRIRRMYY